MGCGILEVIPGRISIEVDARLSFDEEALWTKANQLIALYDQAGVSRDRVLIKLASTWEGIRTAERLEKAGIQTVVMGASFRTLSQIEQLAGYDRLTISPDLLQKLDEDQGPLERLLVPGNAGEARLHLNKAQFRWASNEDAMATEKLAEGIRQFARDQEKLESVLAAL